MERFLRKVFINNWQKKLLAIVSAAVIWLFVNYSITTTKTYVNVPVRVVNIAPDKAISGLMPNGILDRKLTLTLTGAKHVLDKIEPGDFEVVLDSFQKPNEWIVQIQKKNLVSLNPDIDLLHNIQEIGPVDFVIKQSKLLTDKIPIYVTPAKGEPPDDYIYLDVWPKKLTHVVSGPEEAVRKLQAKGIELTLDLSKITKDELDSLLANKDRESDEIDFIVPDSWKRIEIPFLNYVKQEINGPEAKLLRIDFLHRESLPLDQPIPVSVFYPLELSSAVNPKTHPLVEGGDVEEKNGIFLLTKPLFVDNVSRLFLDVVKDRLEFVIVAKAPKNLKDPLAYSLVFIDRNQLEDDYVALFGVTGQKAVYIRERFRAYMRNIHFFTENQEPFSLKAYLEREKIRIGSSEDRHESGL